MNARRERLQRWATAVAMAMALHALLLLRPAPRPIPSPAPARHAVTVSLRPAAAIDTPAAPHARVAMPPARDRRAAIEELSPIAPIASIAPAASPLAGAPPSPPPTPPLVIAAALSWRYALEQGERRGVALLRWRPDGDRYALRLERELDGRALPAWRSEGTLDTQGLTPLRFAQQRRDHHGGDAWRDRQATNFRRDEGLISFSATSERFALPAGVQDRLSWWLQLAAQLAGASTPLAPGGTIRIAVVGLRGEPRDWVFEIVGMEPLALPIGMLAASLHLRRAALGPYDDAIDLWLDPARSWLPVQLQSGDPLLRGWRIRLQDDGSIS